MRDDEKEVVKVMAAVAGAGYAFQTTIAPQNSGEDGDPPPPGDSGESGDPPPPGDSGESGDPPPPGGSDESGEPSPPENP